MKRKRSPKVEMLRVEHSRVSKGAMLMLKAMHKLDIDVEQFSFFTIECLVGKHKCTGFVIARDELDAMQEGTKKALRTYRRRYKLDRYGCPK